MTIFISSLEQSLLFYPLVLGVYISYKLLKVTDLTVEGTLVSGAAIYARLVEYSMPVAIMAALMGGVVIGSLVARMQKYDRVNDLIVGILAVFMLYSINMQIMGRPNISLLSSENLLTISPFDQWIFPLIIVASLLMIMLALLFKTKLGLFLRTFGSNKKIFKILGKNAEKYRLYGLIISNILAALAGVLMAQVNGFADINMGVSSALVAIGAVIIGDSLVSNDRFNVGKAILSNFIGIYIYFFCLNSLLLVGIEPINLKLILGILIFFTLYKTEKRQYVH